MRYIHQAGSAELNHPETLYSLVQQWFKDISAGMKHETVLLVWNLKCSSGVSRFRHVSSSLGIGSTFYLSHMDKVDKWG